VGRGRNGAGRHLALADEILHVLPRWTSDAEALPLFVPDGDAVNGESLELRMLSFLKEFWRFLLARKKLWMLPILIVMALFGGVLVLTKGSAIAPFIYTIF
jgi:hypothetical protein